MRQRMEEMVKNAQNEICAAISELDGTPFHEDTWERTEGGGGRSRVLQEGNIFEKAGVNVSVVHGNLTPEAARSMGGGKEAGETDLRFFATGVSLVIHPWNPMVPTVHANYRYFERGDGDTLRPAQGERGSARAEPVEAPKNWWFGGGADLTPSYLFEDDARHFHAVHKEVCDAHDPSYHSRFKKWCDEYFHIPHRGETRGVGGIFFDDLHDRAPEDLFAFVKDCSAAFLPAYIPIVQKRKDMPYDDSHKRWQQLRRGRYVEFNLVYDRGTTFGLRTGGRIESILMSLPLTARWEYDQHPETGSAEEELLKVLQNPRDWV